MPLSLAIPSMDEMASDNGIWKLPISVLPGDADSKELPDMFSEDEHMLHKSSGIMDEDDASGCKVIMHKNAILYGDMSTNDVGKTAERKNGHSTHEESSVRVPASVLSGMPAFKDLPAEWFEDKYLWQFRSGSKDKDGIDTGGMFVQDNVLDAYMYLAMNSPNCNKVDELPLPKNIVYKDGLFGWSIGIHNNKECKKGFKSIAEADLYLEHGDYMDIVRIVDKDKIAAVSGNPLTTDELVVTVPASFLTSCKGCLHTYIPQVM